LSSLRHFFIYMDSYRRLHPALRLALGATLLGYAMRSAAVGLLAVGFN